MYQCAGHCPFHGHLSAHGGTSLIWQIIVHRWLTYHWNGLQTSIIDSPLFRTMLSSAHTAYVFICWSPCPLIDTLESMEKPVILNEPSYAGSRLVLSWLTLIYVLWAQYLAFSYSSLRFHDVHYCPVCYGFFEMRSRFSCFKSLLSGLPMDPLLFLTGPSGKNSMADSMGFFLWRVQACSTTTANP
jgi:hypothetical protein